jgi:Flp pilus assembly secretin CpaC
LLLLAGWFYGNSAQVICAEQPALPAANEQDVNSLAQAAQLPAGPSPTPGESTVTPSPTSTLGSNQFGDSMRTNGNSYWLDNYPLNELYQYLATQANLQYFHSPALESIKVTGQLFKTSDPLENMRELALQYNLVLYQRGRTIYAKTQEQITDLPQQEFRYELKYLRPSPDDIQQMLKNFLTPERGSITFEPKVNAIVVMDNESAIRRLSTFLKSVDRPKHQISIQVRVISINNSANKGTGIDWTNTLGPNGLALNAAAQANLNSLFGFDPAATWSSITGRGNSSAPGTPTSTSVTVGPIAVSAILRALYGNNRVSMENAPLVVTEDNEPANVSVVTRVPIITSTVTVSNGVTNITDEVRYQIDAKDKTDPPQDRREIGTQLLVTPTILPDGTIRLLINGTVATQTGTVVAPTSVASITNTFPIVNESHIANVARLPAGYSLILGGFINESKTEAKTKVPVLGDIPLFGYAFRSKNYVKQRTNLVFIITPTAYDAQSPEQAIGVSEKNRQNYSTPEQSNYADPETMGHNADIHPPQLRRALADPNEQETDTYPISERNPEVQRAIPVTTRAERKQKKIEQKYRTFAPRALPADQ